MNKYYYGALFFMHALWAMDIPQKQLDHASTPPSSPQWHSVPSSPEVRKYERKQLLAIGDASLKARSTSSGSLMVDLIGYKYHPENKKSAHIISLSHEKNTKK